MTQDFESYESEFQKSEITSWFFNTDGDVMDPDSTELTVMFKLRTVGGLSFVGQYNGFKIILGGRRILKLEPEFANIEDVLLRAIATTGQKEWYGAKSTSYSGSVV